MNDDTEFEFHLQELRRQNGYGLNIAIMKQDAAKERYLRGVNRGLNMAIEAVQIWFKNKNASEQASQTTE